MNVELVDRLLPAMPYLAVMLSLLVTLALFLALKSDLQKFTIRVRKHAVRERQRVDQLAEDMHNLAAKPLPTAEPIYIPVNAPTGNQLTGFNINRRVHALRLLRRGEDTAHIAAALGVPRQEIELLIRVQKLVAQAKRPALQVPSNDLKPQPAEALAEALAASKEPATTPQPLPGVDVAPETDGITAPKPTNIGTIRRRKIAALA